MKEISKTVTVHANEIKIIIFFHDKMTNLLILRLAQEARYVLMNRRMIQVPAESPFYSHNPDTVKSEVPKYLFHLITIALKKHIDIKGNFTVKICITNELAPQIQASYDHNKSNPLIAFIKVNYKELVKNLLCYKLYAGGIVRSFVHELTHFLDPIATECRLKILLAINKQKNEEIAPSMLYLMAVQDLRLEGLSNFSLTKRIRRICVDVPEILTFQHILREAVKIPTWEAAYQFYAQVIRRTTQDMAFLMSYFIGLSFLKEWQVHTIRLGTKITTLRDLNRLMGKGDPFYIDRLPDKVFDKTYYEIKKANYRQFVKLYDKACKTLELTNKYRIITWKQFKQGLKEAHRLSKNYGQLVAV